VSTVILLDSAGRAHFKPSAAVRVLQLVAGPWKALGWLMWIVPKPLRDLGYMIFASLRYRLFGKRDACIKQDEPE
jgi:predicted DCC family thiol-disulfide oxidoreductase YuxK